MVFVLLSASLCLNAYLVLRVQRLQPTKICIEAALDAVENDPDLRHASTVRRLSEVIDNGR